MQNSPTEFDFAKVDRQADLDALSKTQAALAGFEKRLNITSETATQAAKVIGQATTALEVTREGDPTLIGKPSPKVSRLEQQLADALKVQETALRTESSLSKAARAKAAEAESQRRHIQANRQKAARVWAKQRVEELEKEVGAGFIELMAMTALATGNPSSAIHPNAILKRVFGPTGRALAIKRETEFKEKLKA